MSIREMKSAELVRVMDQKLAYAAGDDSVLRNPIQYLELRNGFARRAGLRETGFDDYNQATV